MKDMVVLVDHSDNVIGTMEKMEAHQSGALHRAFSVFIVNDHNQMLLQKRALGKYHSAGLWTNTCCSHQRPGEDSLEAASRRLKEEMGMECELYTAFNFIYRVELDHDLVEHELDHVILGKCNSSPLPDASEVSDWKWVDLGSLTELVNRQPHHFTAWFRIALPAVIEKLDPGRS